MDRGLSSSRVEQPITLSIPCEQPCTCPFRTTPGHQTAALPSSGTCLHDTLIHQSISPFQEWERRFLYFSGEDKQPQFSTHSQINYFSRHSTTKPSPASPTAAATHGVTKKEEMGVESRKSQDGVWQGKAGRSSLHAGSRDKKGRCVDDPARSTQSRLQEGKEPLGMTQHCPAAPGSGIGRAHAVTPTPGWEQAQETPNAVQGLTWNFLKMRSGLKYSWKGVMNSSCCGRQAEQLPSPAALGQPRLPPRSPPGPRPPAPAPAHHGGGGEHAGGGVGSGHGRHAQVFLREALVRHGRAAPPARRGAFNAPPAPPLAPPPRGGSGQSPRDRRRAPANSSAPHGPGPRPPPTRSGPGPRPWQRQSRGRAGKIGRAHV